MESKTRKQIIWTAIKLFGQYGYDTVSMRDIAQQVGVKAGSLYNHFDGKEAIMEAVIDSADEFLSHFQLDSEGILELLQRESPADILRRFVTYYVDEDDTYRMAINRFMYMEMYNNARVLDIVYRHFVCIPVKNLTYTLEVMAEAGAIPRGDYLAIAELWNRSSLVFGYMAAHDHGNVAWEEYAGMTEFFIGLAVRGVRVIPVERIDLHWEHIYQFTEFQGSPANTRELLLRKGLDLFSQHGYASVSMRQIASACGIKAGSIYNHFAGKRELMETLVEGFLTGLQQYQVTNPAFSAVLESGDVHSIILSLSCSYPPMEQIEAYKIYRVLFREQYTNPVLGDIFLRSIERDKQTITQTIDALVSQGRIRPCEGRKIATAYVHTMCSLSIGQTLESQSVDEEYLRPRAVALLVSLILHGYLDEGKETESPQRQKIIKNKHKTTHRL